MEEALDWLFPLPAEIRAKIYNLILQDDILRYRFLSRRISNDIDRHFDHHLELDDRFCKPKWERLQNLRFGSICVNSFVDPPPNGIGTSIFKFPTLIKSISVLQNCKILPENLFYLLTDCGKSVKTLKLHLSSKIIFANLNYEEFTGLFANLKTLEIIGDTTLTGEPNDEDMKNVVKPPTFILQLLSLENLAKLQNLSLVFNLLSPIQVKKTIKSILLFLARNFASLQRIKIEIVQGRHGFPANEISPISNDEFEEYTTFYQKNFGNISKLSSLSILCSSGLAGDEWIKLLCQQKCLCELECGLAFIYPPTIYYAAIEKNFLSLKSLELSDLCLWNANGEVEPFNFALLENCKSLKKITMDRHVGYRVGKGRRRFDTSEILSISLLPQSLEEFAINYFNVLSSELCNLSLLKNLKHVTLTQCGSASGYGVNGTTLGVLIYDNPSTSFLEISPLNFGNSDEILERQKLNEILIKFGYGESHEYFQMSR